jgi:carbonic anhydrase
MVIHLMHQSSDGKIAGVDLNPAGLLPHYVAYYTCMGSLTAPPCTKA